MLFVHLFVSFAPSLIVAHLSRRSTRCAYGIPMVRRPSDVVVRRRRPHIWTWISLRPVGKSWSNFMCSITGVGERLLKVLGKIGSKLWFPWQQTAPIDLQWGKRCLHLFSFFFYLIFLKLAGNRLWILDKFEFWPAGISPYGVRCSWASKFSSWFSHRIIMGKWCLQAIPFLIGSSSIL